MGNEVGNITIYTNAYKKEKEQPDFRGKVDIDGKTYSLSLWTNHEVNRYPVNMSGQVQKEIQDG